MIPRFPFRQTFILDMTLAFCLATLVSKADEALSAGDAPAKVASTAAARAWSELPDLLARIAPPVFPGREFVITDYGAVGDGHTDCTGAFRDAIAACSRDGGGRVVVPAGVFLTGAIHLQSNVNLHLVKNATIRFSMEPKDYLPVVFTRYEGNEAMNFSPFIYAPGQENVAITGEGTLDGQASRAVWYSWKSGPDPRQLEAMTARGVPVEQRIFGDGHHLRPNFIEPVGCKNVLIEGVHIIDSPMWVIHPLYCTNVIVRGVTVETKGPNTDGCDPDSSSDVLIQNCSFSDGDDCIAIKSGRDTDGLRVNLPSRNIVIQNCTFKDGHGGVTVGSETSGGIENVFAENCRFDSPNLDMAMRFKTGMTRGGIIEDIYIRNCATKTAKVGIDMTMKYPGTLNGTNVPVMRDIEIRDCRFANLLDRPIFIEGFSAAVQITDVTIANCDFQNAKSPGVITNASRIHLIDNYGGGWN
jgi:polygalacturonase